MSDQVNWPSKLSQVGEKRPPSEFPREIASDVREAAELLREEPAQQAQPQCEHGFTESHYYDTLEGRPWKDCPGPQQAQPLTGDAVKDLAWRLQAAYHESGKDWNAAARVALGDHPLARDRMAQQAQPACTHEPQYIVVDTKWIDDHNVELTRALKPCIECGPGMQVTTPHVHVESLTALAQQAQPELCLTCQGLKGDKRNHCEVCRGCEPLSPEWLALQAQPEESERDAIRVKAYSEGFTDGSKHRPEMPTREQNRHDLASAIRLEVKCNPQWDSYSLTDAVLAFFSKETTNG